MAFAVTSAVQQRSETMTSLSSRLHEALRGGTTGLVSYVAARAGEGIDAAAWADFLVRYMTAAAESAHEITAALHGHPLEGHVRPLLDHASSYVQNVNDEIPDNIGPLGLLDDSCVVLVTLETLREIAQLPTCDSLVHANVVVRTLLGTDIDTRLMQSITAARNEVLLKTLTSLDAIVALFTTDAAQMAMNLPAPVIPFPSERSSTVAGTTVHSSASHSGSATLSTVAQQVVGHWQWEYYYSSSGFSASTYVVRTLASDGRFSERSRSTASSVYHNSDGSYAGGVSADTGVGPDERGTWAYDGNVLTCHYDDGSYGEWNVTLDGSAMLTVPTSGGERRLWTRL